MKKIILGTSDAWSMRRSSHRLSNSDRIFEQVHQIAEKANCAWSPFSKVGFYLGKFWLYHNNDKIKTLFIGTEVIVKGPPCGDSGKAEEFLHQSTPMVVFGKCQRRRKLPGIQEEKSPDSPDFENLPDFRTRRDVQQSPN